LSNKRSYSLARSFGNLKVRPKLMVLHNLFFLVLTCAAYFAVIPLFEKQVAAGDTISRAKITLFVVLGSIYIAAVVLLEAVIMPLYVYRPLRRMLEADRATRAGDRKSELIPPAEILGDEIGQIMQSRNDTVSELRRQEDELARALRRLEEQDRLVSLGLLSASVAHELNTPLAVLHGSIEKLIETTRDEHTLERLARMQRVTQRLQTISETLVDFAKARKQHTEPVAARGLIDDAWALVAIDPRASGITFTNLVDP
jgi:signal transduction histidine kinase